MPSYTIRSYTRQRAKKLGVTVRRSSTPGKKIDVFSKKNGQKLASIGAAGMGDYPTFMATRGKSFATRRRRAYKRRHEKDRHRRGTPGFYADQLLWA